MEFKFRVETECTLDIDFQKLFNFVSTDAGIVNPTNSDDLNYIYSHFGDNISWFLEHLYKDEPNSGIVSEMVWDEMNDATLDYIWEEFGKWMDETYKF